MLTLGTAMMGFVAATLLTSSAAAQSPPPHDDTPAETFPPEAAIETWAPGQPVPLGYHVERKMRLGLVIGGSVLFAAAYLPLAIIGGAYAASTGYPAAATSAIPVAGPSYFIYSVLKPPNGGDDSCACGVLVLPLVLDALVQAGGLAMMTVGLVGKPALVRGARVTTPTIVPMPLRFANGAGLGIAGTF
jgi:hypothetical protein